MALFASVAVAHPYEKSGSYYGAAPAPSADYSGGASAGAHTVQQVSLAGLAKLVNIDAIEKYLNAPAPAAHGHDSASYSHAKYVVSASAPTAGHVISSSYSAAPAPAPSSDGYGASASPALYVNEAPSISYSAPAPTSSYSAPAPVASYSAPAASYAAPAKVATYAAHAPVASYAHYAPASSGYGASSYGYGGSAAAAPRYTVLPATVTQLNPGKTSYKTYQTPVKYSTVTLPVAASGPVANLYVPEKAGSYGYGSSISSYGGSSY